jgi:hypothetical protein
MDWLAYVAAPRIISGYRLIEYITSIQDPSLAVAITAYNEGGATGCAFKSKCVGRVEGGRAYGFTASARRY